MTAYGPHLTLDLQNCNRKKLEDLDFIFKVLDKLPATIGMTKITAPYVFKYTEGVVPDDWGITGFVIIAESHISIHTYPTKNYVFIDVFSCKDFDTEEATKIIIKAFEAKKVEKHVVQRGIGFPRKEALVKQV